MSECYIKEIITKNCLKKFNLHKRSPTQWMWLKHLFKNRGWEKKKKLAIKIYNIF